MAEDPGLVVGVRPLIDEGIAAARAVYEAFAKYRDLLAGPAGTSPSGSPTWTTSGTADRPRSRASRCRPRPRSGHGRAVCADRRDLAPADTALLRPDARGRRSSPRRAGRPATPRSSPGRWACPPSSPARARRRSGRGHPGAGRRHHRRRTARARREAERGPRGERADGAGRRRWRPVRPGPRPPTAHAVPLLANIGGPADLPAALAAGAEGVGLFRTEFLFLDRTAGAVRGGAGGGLPGGAGRVPRRPGRGADAGRGRRQAAGASCRPARRAEPGAGRARPAAAREPPGGDGGPARRAGRRPAGGQPRGRAPGDGADGGRPAAEAAWFADACRDGGAAAGAA